jgi:hypothetical protein
MMIFLGFLALLVVAASLWADYKWKQWMAHHPRGEEPSPEDPPARRQDRF